MSISYLYLLGYNNDSSFIRKVKDACSIHEIELKSYIDNYRLTSSNSHFEFSGYLNLIEASSSQDDVILANDTLFKHHATRVWLQALGQSSPKALEILGDGRLLFEKKFLASYFFKFGAGSLAQMEAAIRKVKNSFFPEAVKSWSDLNELTESLSDNERIYIHDWLFGGSIFRGWHNSKARDKMPFDTARRKIISILMEWRLSKELQDVGLNAVDIKSVSSVAKLANFLDRVENAKNRIKNRL